MTARGTGFRDRCPARSAFSGSATRANDTIDRIHERRCRNAPLATPPGSAASSVSMIRCSWQR